MASEQNRLEYYAKVNTVRDLIDLAAERYGDKPFIKYLEGDGITEKSFSELRSNSLALSRYIRSICPRRMRPDGHARERQRLCAVCAQYLGQ